MNITICDWMVNDLHLQRSELIAFAVIYAYKNGEWFNIPRREFSNWLGTSPRGVSKTISSLTQKGVIEHEVLVDDRGCYAAFKIPENILNKYDD